MAARFNPEHDARTREKIQTSQLVNRLNSFALDTTETVRMSSDQVRAALGLLRKTIPDLSSTTLGNGDGDGNPVVLHLIAAQLVSAEIIQQRQAPPTIQHEPEHTVDLLDQPPPLE
jgi:hypothetical protein